MSNSPLCVLRGPLMGAAILLVNLGCSGGTGSTSTGDRAVTDKGSGDKAPAESKAQADDPRAQELVDRLARTTPTAIVKKDASGSVTSAALALTKVTDADLEVLKGLPKLKKLGVGSTKITDEGLIHIGSMKQLEFLLLSNNRISDVGLEHLSGLTNLKELDLYSVYGDGSKITDAGLRHLKNLTNLEVLILNATSVSDASLEVFKNMTKLKDLRLSSTRVTKEGVAKLRQALPQCDITY